MAEALIEKGAAAGHDGGSPVLARFSIDRPKAWLLFATHMALPTFVFWRLLQGDAPLRENLMAVVVMVSVFGFAAWSVLRDLRAPDGTVVLEAEGFRDFRRGPHLIPWDQVGEASMKRGILTRGVKIVLVDGNRADIDTSLLNVRPRKLTGLIVELLQKRAPA